MDCGRVQPGDNRGLDANAPNILQEIRQGRELQSTEFKRLESDDNWEDQGQTPSES